MRTLALVPTWLFVISACSGAASPGADAATPPIDGGPSSSMPVDAGPIPSDGAVVMRDAAVAQRDGSVAVDAGSSGGGSAECNDLDGCCARIGEAATRSGCETVVGLAMPDLCRRTLADYRGAGWCTEGTSCATLGACCPSLRSDDGWRPTCERTARENNEPQCARVLDGYRRAGSCEP